MATLGEYVYSRKEMEIVQKELMQDTSRKL